MKRLSTAVILLAAATTARAEWQSLDGQEAPSFEVDKWFNPAEGSTIDDLRGKAILLEFWATW
jgi:hypothetical protein